MGFVRSLSFLLFLLSLLCLFPSSRGQAILHNNLIPEDRIFTFPDEPKFSNMGVSVAVDGPLLVVGQEYHPITSFGLEPKPGLAYVFYCPSLSSCVEIDRISALNGTDGDRFGRSVAVRGTTVFVAAEEVGAVYLFDCSSLTFCEEKTKLEIVDRFGEEIVLFGSIVGIRNYNIAFFFNCTSDFSCIEIGRIGLSSITSLAISDNLVVVGDYTREKAYVYDCPSFDSCTQRTQLQGAGADSNAEFGHAVAIRGSHVLVGAPFQDGTYRDYGTVFIFDCSSNSSCTQISRLDPVGYSRLYGFGFGLIGDYLLIGAPYHPTSSSLRSDGIIYIYSCPTFTTCTIFGQFLSGNTTLGYAWDFAFSGSLMAVGAVATDTNRGTVHLHDLSQSLLPPPPTSEPPTTEPPTTEPPTTEPPTTEPPTTEPPTTEPPTTQPPSFCPGQTFGNAVWEETIEETVASGTCVSGFSGSPSRRCHSGGGWASSISNGCQRTRCTSGSEANADWPSVFSGNFAQGICQPGFVGNPFRQCLLDGTWGPVEDPCIDESIQCPAQTYGNAQWNPTNGGSLAQGTCTSGYTGSPSRRCLPGGTWEGLITNHCQKLPCPAEVAGNANWPSTFSRSSILGSCLDGFVGNPFRQCLLDGTWGSVQDACVPETLQCPAQTYGNAQWNPTNGGSLAQGTCTSGYTGSPSRRCLPGGRWEGLITNHCQKLPCPAEVAGNANWPSTLSRSTIPGTCLDGFVGRPARICQSDGTWGPVQGACVPETLQCSAEIYANAQWEDTNGGTRAQGTCLPGFSGSPSRNCMPGGDWESLVVNHCSS